MRARSPNTGPPGARNVDAVAAANHHGTKSRRQPISAKDNLRFGFLRQVAKRPLGLAYVEKVLSPERLALGAGDNHTKVSAAAARRPTSTRKEAHR
jgi:hypothetical protein